MPGSHEEGRLPTGTVTFFFTDIEQSTALWERATAAMDAALATHDEILHRTIGAHGGHVFSTGGDGVSAVFARARDALAAAVDVQLALSATEWPPDVPISVRIGLHTGESYERGGDYFGPAVNRAARVMAAANATQILLTETTAAVVAYDMPLEATLVDLGQQRLRGVDVPVHLYRLEHPGLVSDPRPPRTDGGTVVRLPSMPGRLFGRDGDVAAITDALRTARTVTLTGVGGVGKTSLAVEVVRRVCSVDGEAGWGQVVFCDLSPLSPSGSVAHAVARVVQEAMGHRSGTAPVSPDALGTLVHQLGGGSWLLVLDSCEHVVSACAQVATELIERCDGLRLLATSREPLRIRSERVYRVAPLPVSADRDDLDGDAVGMFIERATAATPDFDVSASSREAVVELCRRLDGLPLAIELAAARVSHLAPAEIVADLDNRFRLLASRGAQVAGRHRTLEGMLDWSYDLLDDQEAMLFRRLAAFAGSFDLAAIGACCTHGIGRLPAIDLLGNLVDKSLVVAEHGGPNTRYRLLESVRAYARERLVASTDAETVLDAHASWCLSLLESFPWDERVLSPTIALRLEEHYPDLRQALEWCHERGRLGVLSRLTASLTGLFGIRGHLADADRWFPVAIDHERGLPAAERTATVLASFLVLLRWDGDVALLREHRSRLAALRPQLRDGSFLAAIASATLASLSSRLSGAIDEWERHADAALSDASDAPRLAAMAACQKARALLARGADEQAIAVLERALPGQDEDRDFTYLVADDLALALHLHGDHDRAIELARPPEVDSPLLVRIPAIYRGLSEAALGDGAVAREQLRIGLETLRRESHRRQSAIGDCRMALGALAAIEGRYEEAAQLLASLTPASVSINAFGLLVERYQKRVREALTEERWAALAAGAEDFDVVSAARRELGLALTQD